MKASNLRTPPSNNGYFPDSILEAAKFLAVLILLLGALPAGAQAGGFTLTLEPGSKLWLEGDSTLHSYHSSAGEIRLAARLSGGITDGVFGSPLAEGALRDFSLSIPVLSLKSGKKALDRKMYKLLKAGNHPQIVFRLLKYQVHASTPAGTYGLQAEGRLFVAGEERPLTLEAKASFAEGMLRIVGQKALLMTDFGIKPPKMFLGALKTDDRILVRFDLFFDSESGVKSTQMKANGRTP